MTPSTNIYQRAREITGITQERAAEYIGISVESIKAYERGQRLPPDPVVIAMVDIYNAQYLAYQHLRNASPLGQELIPPAAVNEKGLAEAVCTFFSALPKDIDKMQSSLIEIAADGIISDQERPVFDGIMESLEKLIESIYGLKYFKPKEDKA